MNWIIKPMLILAMVSLMVATSCIGAVNAVTPEDLIALAISDVEGYLECSVRVEVLNILEKILVRLERAKDWLSSGKDSLVTAVKTQLTVAIQELTFLEGRIPHYDLTDINTADLMRTMDFHDTAVIIQSAYGML